MAHSQSSPTPLGMEARKDSTSLRAKRNLPRSVKPPRTTKLRGGGKPDQNFKGHSLTFVTGGAHQLRLDQRQSLEALQRQHPEQLEWLMSSLQKKAVLVIRIGGYRYSGFENLLLLQCAHIYGIPILFLPFQEESGEEDWLDEPENNAGEINQYAEGDATPIHYYRLEPLTD